MWKPIISRAVAVALLLANVGLFPLNLQASTATEKLKVNAILIDEQSRQRACKGSFIETKVDFANFLKVNGGRPCVIKIISDKPLSGNIYLQIKQGVDWIDICTESFWASNLSKRDCHHKINRKEHLGKLFSKTWTCTYPGSCAGTFDYSTPVPYVLKKAEGDFCINPAIDNAEFRVRVTSGTEQFFSNAIKIKYLGAEKVIVQGGRCVLVTSSSSFGTSPAQGPTAGRPSPALPECSVNQIRQHATLSKSFNEYRSLFLDAIALRTESINGMNKASLVGDRTAYEGWGKNLVDSTALARSVANDAIDTQNRIIALMQQCAFSYGIVVTQPYGFIVTDENSRGYQFPNFTFP